MRKNRLLSIIAAMFAIGIFMVIFGDMMGDGQKKEDASTLPASTEQDENGEKNSDAYSYAEVQKYIAYLADDEEQKTALNRLVDPLLASDSIRVSYMKKVVEILGVEASVYTGVLKDSADGDIVKKAEFEKIYDYIVNSDAIKGISHKDIYLFDRVSDYEDGSTQIYDGVDYYGCDVDIPDEYNDKIIDAYIKDGVIFKLNGYSTQAVVLKNVWIISIGDGRGSFLYDKVIKEYPALSTVAATETDELKDGFVADITIDSMGIKDYTAKTDITKVKISDVSEGKLITAGNEELKLADNYVIYNAYAKPFCEDSLGILKGYKRVELIQTDDEVEAVVIRRKLISDKIRVLISNDEYTSYNMKTVTISCGGAFTVKYADGTTEENVAGTSVTVDDRSYSAGDKIVFTPVDSDTKLQVLSINRDCGNPEYRGKLELTVTEDGVRLINELPLEEYLYSVVASEMNSNSHLEALKAMAICARGYAYSRILDDSYAPYDAHIDDSNLCQMYNSVAETEDTIYAVKETYGIVPTYNNEIITALYFSTSAGVTCTNSDIWGGTDYEYLKSNVEDIDKSEIDLSTEKAFKKFIRNSAGFDTLEKDLPYYRWEVAFTADEISAAVKSTLKGRYEMSPDNFSFLLAEDDEEADDDEEPVFDDEAVDDIGEISAIKITKRSKSGVILAMDIEGSLATIRVTGQTNIRNLITPENADIIKQDGTVMTGWTSLPSPFYYVERTENGFVIRGGGFGHGAGMSQNGARLLAEAGYDAEYILKHYYTNIELDKVDDVLAHYEETDGE